MSSRPGGTELEARPANGDFLIGGLRPPSRGDFESDSQLPVKVASPVTWVGGKGRLLKHILPFIEPHPGESVYVEPFGGSGVVLINKERHPCECYNDTDGDLVNLFRVIRDPDGVVHLWWELINTPVSRQEFRDALELGRQPHSPLTPVQKAASFVTRCRQRFGGGMTGTAHSDNDRSWGTTRMSNRGMGSTVSRWLTALEDFPAVHRRVATVVVDQQDAVRCVGQWDSPSTLFYCDPPYVGHEDYYQGGFDEAAHKRLAEALNAAQGRAVVSYYPCDLVEELYPAKRWRRHRVETIATACGNKKRDPNGKAPKARECQKRIELILTNFDPRTRRKL